MREPQIMALGLALLLLLPVAPAIGQEEPEEPPSPGEEPSSFDTLMERSDLGNVVQAAMARYHAGHRHLERAVKLEERLPEVPEAKREKAEKTVRKAWEAAAAEYLEAIRTNPKLLEAYHELGRSYRALGRHEDAVGVYNAALERQPEDAESIYGRGESFLALNYLREAATTWTELEESDPERAAKLMASMKRWVEEHRADPGDIRPDAVETLAAWIDQQQSPPAADPGG